MTIGDSSAAPQNDTVITLNPSLTVILKEQ